MPVIQDVELIGDDGSGLFQVAIARTVYAAWLSMARDHRQSRCSINPASFAPGPARSAAACHPAAHSATLWAETIQLRVPLSSPRAA